jgi:hypothetical protein
MNKDNKTPVQRSNQQNKALHKYCEMVAHELENGGHTMQDVVKKIDMCEIYPTTRTVKEIIFKPIQEAVLGKKSTTELTTNEINKVYEVMSMFLAKEFEISLPFPSIEQTELYLKSYEN